MNHAALSPMVTTTPPRPTLFSPHDSERNVARWRINGFGASIFVWTAEEWENLPVRPQDAQYYPSGVWAALRMD